MSLLPRARRITAVAAAVALCTCGTLDRFDVDTHASAHIQKSSLPVAEDLLGLLPFDGFDKIDFSKDIANQGVSEDQIDSVKLKRLVLHTGESGLTMDFIESVEFYVEAEGQPRLLVATGTDFEGETSVELDLPDAELKPYVVAPFMTFEAEVNGKRPEQDTTITADVTLTVDATVPGCE
jgi:hypothetical protein